MLARTKNTQTSFELQGRFESIFDYKGGYITSFMHVLRAVQKHVPCWNMFQIGMVVCRSEKCAFLIHIPDWYCTNSSYRSCVLNARSWSIKHLCKETKITAKLHLFLYFLFLFLFFFLFFSFFFFFFFFSNKCRATSNSMSKIDIAVCPRHDKVCTVPMWNMFKKCIYIFQNGAIYLCNLNVICI